MANDGQKRSAVPVPEAPPPDFHRPAKRKYAKPYALEVKYRPGERGFGGGFHDWTPITRHRRERDAVQAVKTYARDRLFVARAVGPDGVIATSEERP